MLRRIIVGILVIILSTSAMAMAQSSTELTLLDKIVSVEKFFYGSEQTGSLIDRTSKLEKDVYGTETKESLMTKLDRLYIYARENSAAAPSFLTKTNAVEWALTHSIASQQPAKSRIENLERVLMGNGATGSFDDRLNKLLKLAYPNGQIDIFLTSIAKDTLIKIKIVTPISTKTSRSGDIVAFQAAEDVYAGGQLVIAKGAQGVGKVTKVEPPKNFGRDAELQISFDTVEAIDGSFVGTILGEKAKEETKSLAKAAGATVAGLAILGPIGVVGGAFVHGQDINIPADAQMYIQTKTDIEVYGLQLREAR